MDTPICDFVNKYCQTNTMRLHMPGHKGIGPIGSEMLDITEINGADSLFHADGIIRSSENNAGEIFGCHTLYATEGSSLCIRAMLYLCSVYARSRQKSPVVAAARNIHSAFISAAALLDLPVQWLYGSEADSYLSCMISPAFLDRWLRNVAETPTAIYITSPDYLGTTADIKGLAQVCHNHDVLLIVDNAHGAYRKFLPISQHPMDLGADLCCDSAHKTLPVLTGGAYLHIHKDAPALLHQQAKNAMALFASTSPSYLILQSLDAANQYMAGAFSAQLKAFLPLASCCKTRLEQYGYRFIGDEELKWTIDCKAFGYTGTEIAQCLRKMGIEPEFSDPDYLVLMLSPLFRSDDLDKLEDALYHIPPLPPILCDTPPVHKGNQIVSIRNAALSCSEIIPVQKSLGRILASPSVSCPPAVPIVICGERIDQHAIDCFLYYGIDHCNVVIE